MNKTEQCVSAYREHRNLFVASNETGIPWQTIYWHLKKAGEPVIGDKARYGSDKDRLAAKGEAVFQRIVPHAKDMNLEQYQSKVDFMVGDISVDVKAATPKQSSKKFASLRWAFSVKKQEFCADFIVCVKFNEDHEPVGFLMIPGEFVRNYQTISVSARGGKWDKFALTESELADFFRG